MYEDMMQKHGFIPSNHTAPVFFPVSLEDIYDKTAKQIPGYKAVIRGDTGDTLKVHTDSYGLVPYEKSFGTFEDAIYKSGLDTQGMRIGTDVMNGGGKIFRQYLFPNIKEKISDTEIALTISMFDSYDGSTAFIGRSGHFNFRCANMGFAGRAALEMKVKHTGNTYDRQVEAIKLIVAAAERYVVEAKRMREWPNIGIAVDRARNVLEAIPQSTDQLCDTLLASYAVEKEHNMWTLYNCLTAWSTHTPDGKTKMKIDRQKRILDLVEGKDWKMLEAA
jgi:hypothetical protein